MDFVLQLMENGVVMLLANRRLETGNKQKHLSHSTRSVAGYRNLLACWYLCTKKNLVPQRPLLGTKEMPTARISTCHKKI